MENTTPSSRVGLKGVVTLLIVIVLGSLGFAYWLYSQNEALKKSNNELQAKYSSSDSLLSQITDEQKIISDTSAVVVNLAGTKAAPHAKASVYWDSTAASVYLVVKNMPELRRTNCLTVSSPLIAAIMTRPCVGLNDLSTMSISPE